MLYGILLVIHVFVCLALMIAVLLQSGKGGGLAGAFGGGAGSQAIFGGRGAATFLSNATTILGVAFMVTSLSLALLGGAGKAARSRSLIREDLQRQAPVSTETPVRTPGAGQSDGGLIPGTAGGGPATGGTVGGAPPPAAGTSASTGTTVPAGGAPAGSSPGGPTGGK